MQKSNQHGMIDPGMLSDQAALLEELRALRESPASITDVILSHHHLDHTLNAACFQTLGFTITGPSTRAIPGRIGLRKAMSLLLRFARSKRLDTPHFASAGYTWILPEERTAKRNCGRAGRSKRVPNGKREMERSVRNMRLQVPAVRPGACGAANESCTSPIHPVPQERRHMSQIWKLVGPDGKPYTSAVPGTLGGHSYKRIYGRLDCPAALRAIARGGYVTHRVFFLTEEHALAAGYRPCAVCLPLAYAC